MHLTSSIFALTLSVATTLAQTPAGFTPRTNERLGVAYSSNTSTTYVVPGIELPQALTATQPVVNTTLPSTNTTNRYILALLDLSLPASRITTGERLNPGLGSNRTTRLHWLQANLTINVAGLLTPYQNTTPIARYAPPQPPAGDIPHYYAFFLFSQPATFSVPTALRNGSVLEAGSTLRNNFNISTIANQTGVSLLGGNYILVQNANNSGAATSPRPSNSTVVPSTGGAGKINALLPAVGLGAIVMALLC